MTEATAVGSKKIGAIKFVRDILVIIFSALLISFLLKTFLIRSFFIPSSSMENTLQVEDRVMVNQLVPQIIGIKRGDIVVFKDPGGWLTAHPKPEPNLLQQAMQFVGLQPDTSNDYLIKRVIGKGGDRVTCCNSAGNIEINGQEIIEPYVVKPPGETRVSGIEFDVTVPEGSLWLLGDNRYGSQDARAHLDLPSGGFVAESEVVGHAFLRNWPLARIGILGSYPEVFAEVPAPKTGG